jgi:hypothetical protein
MPLCYAYKYRAQFAPGGSLIISGSTMAGSENNWHDAGRNYRSFLLRCWQEDDLVNGREPGVHFVWRFALVPIDDQSNARGFACLEELFAYLGAELAAELSPPL